MYVGVPGDMPVSVMREPPVLDAAGAIPKSATTAWPR
jgi:hypothetical protein